MGVQGYTIPKGTFVGLPKFLIHTDEAVYAKPLEWDPHRFTEPRREGEASKYDYFGFGIPGPHYCPGKQFVYVQLKVLISLLFKADAKAPSLPSGACLPGPSKAFSGEPITVPDKLASKAFALSF